MDWSASPFVVPVAAFAMVLGIIIVANISNYHNRKLRSEERLAAIAKGIPLPPDPEPEPYPPPSAYAPNSAYRARGRRTGGIVLVSTGIGLSIFGIILAWILQEHDVLVVAAAGLIPLAVGIGLLVDCALHNSGSHPEAN